MSDLVSAIVAYYPATKYVSNMRDFVARFQVPILVMASERDSWCPLESLRAMEAAAKEGKKPFELVFCPPVEHAFAIPGNTYNEEYDAVAWQRTSTMLSQYHPVRAQTAPPAPKVQLPSGETVWDLSGDWDTFHENYGSYARYGTYPNVFRITQTDTTFTGIRLKNNPSPSPGRAGSPQPAGRVREEWIQGSVAH